MLLDEKASTTSAIDPHTARYLKLIEKTIKKILKILDKMHKMTKLDETEPVNHMMIVEKFENLLLTDLDIYLEKLRGP